MINYKTNEFTIYFLIPFSVDSKTRVDASSRYVRVEALLMTDTSLKLDRVESISVPRPGTKSNWPVRRKN